MWPTKMHLVAAYMISDNSQICHTISEKSGKKPRENLEKRTARRDTGANSVESGRD
jgi:hypothetical protein